MEKLQVVFSSSLPLFTIFFLSLSVCSTKAAGLRQSAGRGGASFQLTARDGDAGGHGAHHSGHPADLPGPAPTQG